MLDLMPNSGGYGTSSHIVNDLDVVTRPLSTSVSLAKNGKNGSGVCIPLSSPALSPNAGILSMCHRDLHLNTVSY